MATQDQAARRGEERRPGEGKGGEEGTLVPVTADDLTQVTL